MYPPDIDRHRSIWRLQIPWWFHSSSNRYIDSVNANYNYGTMGVMRLKSPATRRFIYNYLFWLTSKTVIPTLCERNPPVTSVFPHKGPVTREASPCDIVMPQLYFVIRHNARERQKIGSQSISLFIMISTLSVLLTLCGGHRNGFTSQTASNAERWYFLL